MGKIVGIDGWSAEALAKDVQQGGRFKVFYTCVSLVVVTMRIPSDIHYVPAGRSAAAAGLLHTLGSLVLGWWGIPFGPIFTIWAVTQNLGGGKDVTMDVTASIFRAGPRPPPGGRLT